MTKVDPVSRWRPAGGLKPAAAFAAIVGLWFAVATTFALQGHALSLWRGQPQPWWPSFGYSLAIFSIWALMTPAVVLVVRRVASTRSGPWIKAAALAAGLPAIAALHVGLFALLYWPAYNGGGRIATRFAMGERMFLANLDTNTLFYVMVVGVALVWRPGGSKASVAAPTPAEQQPDVLRIRIRGRLRLVPLSDVVWIGAAGGYSEVHAGGETHLLEEPLKVLAERLPPSEFARIHRGAVVRLDRVVEVRGAGRGDARVRLADGVELRLSRRYRAGLAGLLGANRARPSLRRSRSPETAGAADGRR